MLQTSANHVAARRQRETLHSHVSKMILRGIKQQLNEVESFTREDLLHLRVLQHISTITRYNYVCLAVRELIDNRQLAEVSRTQLILRGRKGLGEPVHIRYAGTIDRLVASINSPLAVMDVVDAWKTDQHLTINSKRVGVRVHLRAMARAGRLNKEPDYTYSRGE